jgi:hypothetical protein
MQIRQLKAFPPPSQVFRSQAGTRANQVWALDMTHIPMARGFVYLTAVVGAPRVAHRVVRSSQATPAAVHNSATLANRPGIHLRIGECSSDR